MSQHQDDYKRAKETLEHAYANATIRVAQQSTRKIVAEFKLTRKQDEPLENYSAAITDYVIAKMIHRYIPENYKDLADAELITASTRLKDQLKKFDSDSVSMASSGCEIVFSAFNQAVSSYFAGKTKSL